jgi:hypothetical protein
MRRTVVVIILPLEMGKVARIMAAVSAEFPDATMSTGDDPTEVLIEAEDGNVLEVTGR